MPGPVYGDSSINPETEILGFDSAQSGGTYKLGFPRGLTVLLNGSVSLLDTERLQRVDRYVVHSISHLRIILLK